MKELPTKPCLNCGKPAKVRQGRWDRTKFCSRKCYGMYRAAETAARVTAEAAARRPAVIQPTEYRLIALTKGRVAQVDIEDFDFAVQFNWAFSDKGYARRTIKIAGRKKHERLHRVITERKLGHQLDATIQVDHIDGDRLNCRRHNLRTATHIQNSYNSRRRNKLGYTGVAKNHRRFMASIKVDTKDVYIGTFDTAEEAAYMRDCYAITMHGDFALLNFDYIEVPRHGYKQAITATNIIEGSHSPVREV